MNPLKAYRVFPSRSRPGRFTKEKIVPEGLFTIVLYTECVMVDGKPTYYFTTQNSGNNTCKSPEGMFPDLRIENNLQYVLDCIRAYYQDEQLPAPKSVKVRRRNILTEYKPLIIKYYERTKITTSRNAGNRRKR